MKKILLFGAAALMSFAASAVEKMWNFGEMFEETGDIKGPVTVDGLTFYSEYVEGAEKQSVWSVATGSGASTDGYAFTKTLKSGGSSSWYGQPTEESEGLPESQWTPRTRMMSFEVDGPTDIILYYVRANNSANDRYAEVFAGSAENSMGKVYSVDPSSAISPVRYRYNGEACTIYIGVNGINFYGIRLADATVQPDQYEVYTYVELAAGSENPDGVDPLGTILMSPSMPENGYDEGTEVTLTCTPAQNFVLDSWEVGGEIYHDAALKIVVSAETTDITAYVKYVDPRNTVPGYLDGTSCDGGSIRNWLNENTRGVCLIPVTAGIATPTKEDFTANPWPAAGENYGVDFPARQGAKGSQAFGYVLNVSEAGEYNMIVAASNKQTAEGTISVQIFSGENSEGDIVAEGDGVLPITFQDWNYYEVKVALDGTIPAGSNYAQVRITNGDSGRAVNMLYCVMGLGDNYGGWYDGTDPRNPQAGIEAVAVDKVNAPVKYYNLQGIEVKADTKGLIILSNGTKVLNK